MQTSVNIDLLTYSCGLLLVGAAIIAGAGVLGGIVGGLIRSFTGVDEEVISLTTRLCAVGATIYFSWQLLLGRLLTFATELWSLRW